MMKYRFLVLLSLLLSALILPGRAAHAESWEGDKVLLGEDFVLQAGEILDGNLAVFGGNVTLEASSEVRGDVVVAGGALEAAGLVHGSVTAFGGNVALADSAVIRGDLGAFGAEVVQAPGTTIEGESFTGLPWLGERVTGLVPEDAGEYPRSGVLGQLLRWQVITFSLALLFAVLGAVAVWVAPRAVERVADAAASQPAYSFGLGLLTLILGLSAGALLLIACGLGLLVWLALAGGLVLGWIAMGVWVGQRTLALLKVRSTSAVAEVALGAFLITVLARVPFCIGFLFGVVIGSIGLGAVVTSRFGTQGVRQSGTDGSPV